MEPEAALQELETVLVQLDQSKQEVPLALRNLYEAIQAARHPWERAQQTLKEAREGILDRLDEVDAIPLSRVVDARERLLIVTDQVTGLVEHEGADLASAKDVLRELQKGREQLERVEAYLLARAELEKPDANLVLVGDSLQQIEQDNLLKRRAPEMRRKLEQLAENDREISIRLENAEALLTTKDAAVTDFIQAYDELWVLENRPSTLQSRLADVKQRLRNRIRESLESLMLILVEHPEHAEIEQARSLVPRFVQEFPGHELASKVEGALYEAEAATAEMQGDWKTAWTWWKKAEESKRPYAEERRLACLKLWAMADANIAKLRTLRSLALEEPELKDDEDLISWDAWSLFQEIDEAYQDPEKLSEKKETSEFNKVRNRLNRILGRVVEEAEPSEAEGPGSLKLISVWRRFGYRDQIESLRVPRAPDPHAIAQFAADREALYRHLLRVVKKVRPDAGLYQLLMGRRLAEQWDIAHLPKTKLPNEEGQGSPPFEELWERYRDFVVRRITEMLE
jgi:hypothetical protein